MPTTARDQHRSHRDQLLIDISKGWIRPLAISVLTAEKGVISWVCGCLLPRTWTEIA